MEISCDFRRLGKINSNEEKLQCKLCSRIEVVTIGYTVNRRCKTSTRTKITEKQILAGQQMMRDLNSKKTHEERLGEFTERMLQKIGVTKERYIQAKELFGLSPICDCDERKEWLNSVSDWWRKFKAA